MPNQPTTAATTKGDFKTLLEAASPGAKTKITDLTVNATGGTSLNTPELLLHCDSPECSGVRTFRLSSKDIVLSNTEWRYGIYSTYAEIVGKASNVSHSQFIGGRYCYQNR